jgi:DNA-binding HxlR family transcriptional regulator
MYRIITRTIYDSMPVTVEYALTLLGNSMRKLLDEIMNWGRILGKRWWGSEKKTKSEEAIAFRANALRFLFVEPAGTEPTG